MDNTIRAFRRLLADVLLDALSPEEFLHLRIICKELCNSTPVDAIAAAVFAFTRPFLDIVDGYGFTFPMDPIRCFSLGQWRRAWAQCAEAAELLGETAGIWAHGATSGIDEIELLNQIVTVTVHIGEFDEKTKKTFDVLCCAACASPFPE